MNKEKEKGRIKMKFPSKIKKDPVCGRNIDANKAIAKIKYGREFYYLCCPTCLYEFSNNPEKFINELNNN